MKTKSFRLLTVLLAAVMFVALSLQVYAAQSNAVTKDGLTAQLFTDKDTYKTGESVKASVRVDNRTGKEVFIFNSFNVPSGVTLEGSTTAYDALLKDGESWTSAEGILLSAGQPVAAGSAATGDTMQTGFWVLLTVLAVCGMAALFVYGKNKKTWISMLLCLAMVGGMAVTTLPAKAADVTGTLELSCPIQVDGKDTAITAVVNYILYDDAEAGSEVSGEATAPTEAPTAEPTAVPTETPTETPTEVPTEIPTETPTEAPTEIPTETPTEAPTDIIDAEETGYYLVWEDFTNPTPNTYSSNIPSSWDAQAPAGGLEFVTTDEIKIGSLVDKSEYADAVLQRQFNPVSGKIVWEFTLNATGDVENAVVVLASEDKTAIKFTLVNGNLTANGKTIAAVPDGTELVGIKVELDTETDTYIVSADGTTLQEVFDFEEDCDSVDRMYLQTTEENIGTLGLSLVRVYTNLYVNEKFLTSTKEIPDDWTWNGEGSVNVIRKMGSVSPDLYNLELTDNGADKQTVISKEVTYTDDEAWLEYHFLIPEGSNAELAMVLETEEGETFKVGNTSANGNYQFGYYDENDDFVALYDMIDEQWYHVLVKVTRNETLIYLNHKLQADEISLPFVKFDTISFETSMTGTGTVLLDDILLKDYVDYPDDYVPEPELPEEDDYIVGLQSCSLWKEGSHFGWDWISDWDERHTYLGFYDEMSPEAADWAIKWQLEHSVDYELYCWYRPPVGAGEPIKQPRNAYALEEAFFNAKYSNQAKFAIAWENSSVGNMDSQDFRENIVSYWLEQYFKDDRYMLIDNKPVIGLYKFSTLLSCFGSVDGVKAELDYLRQACKDAGFDGCVVMLVAHEASATSLQQYKDAGIDCLYAYSWGGTAENQKEKIVAQNNVGIMDVLPTICMGRDDSAWERGSGYYLTDDEFRGLADWAKNTYMASAEEGSFSSRMVMLGNWNEYGEGHFIMPANLHGFGYIDAVREVFGDGAEHEDIIPTAEQRERINHMYVQDREVIKVKKDDDSSTLDVLAGYYFEEEADLEGWTIGTWKGENLDVENLRQEDGAMKGNTYLGDASYADPALLAPEVEWSADQITQIKVRMKASVGMDTPQLYFITNSNPAFAQTQCIESIYSKAEVDEEGYSIVTFDVQSNKMWKGTVTQVRLDPITKAGSFEIDSVEIMTKKKVGDVTVYRNGTEISTENPVQIINETVMFPVEDLSSLVNTTWCERNDGTAVEVFIASEYLYRFPVDSDIMVVNGETVEVPQGVATIEGITYVPVADMLVHIGYIVEWDEEEKVLEIAENLPYDIKKAYYFEDSLEGWMPGGSKNSLSWVNGNAYAVAGDDSLRFWSPDSSMGLATEEVTHIRVLIKSDITNQHFKINCILDNGTATYSAPYVAKEGGYAEIIIDCSTNSLWADSTTLNRLCIYPFSNNVGKGCYVDSVELIQWTDIEEQPDNPGIEDENCNDDGVGEIASEQYKVLFGSNYFREGNGNWQPGGSTGITASGGALKVTAAADGKPRIWTSYETEGVCNDPLNISAAELTHIRIRIKSDVTNQKMLVECKYRDKDGNEKGIWFNDLTYEANNDTYAEVLIDCSSVDDSYTLERMAIYPFGINGNEALANQSVYLGSVEYLQERTDDTAEEPLKVLILGNSITQHGPSAAKGWLANWGMAATCPENDYVHLLQDKILAKNANVDVHWGNIAEFEKYFYDWSKINGDFSKYVDFDADIIICTIGGNITNGQWEEDSSYENSNTFTKEHYKAILDYFNPGSDATILVGTFFSTKTEILNAIIEASEAYDYTYFDMTDWEYGKYDIEDDLKAALGVD